MASDWREKYQKAIKDGSAAKRYQESSKGIPANNPAFVYAKVYGDGKTGQEANKPVKGKKITKPPKVQHRDGEIAALGAGDYGASNSTRFDKTMNAAIYSTAAALENLHGTLKEKDARQRARDEADSKRLKAGYDAMIQGEDIYSRPGGLKKISEDADKDFEARYEKVKGAGDEYFRKADEMKKRSEQQQKEAKEGLGGFGQFAVDLGIAGAQFAGDIALNAALPGAGLAAMGMRAAGSAAQEARQGGRDIDTQLNTGLKSAAIEVLTEKLFGLGSKAAYGSGLIKNEKLINGIVNNLAKTNAGRTTLKLITGAAEEGAEEVLSDILNPVADRILKLDDGKGDWSDIGKDMDTQQMLADFLIGGTLGLFGAGTNVVNGQFKAENAQQREYEKYQRELVNMGLEAEPGSRAQKAAETYKPIVEKSGKHFHRNLSDAETENLARLMDAPFAKKALADANILIDDNTADIIARAANGQRINQSERERLQKIPNIGEVINEVALAGVKARALERTFTQELQPDGITLPRGDELLRDKTIESAERLSKITGREIRLYNADPSENGYYDRTTGELYINRNSKNPLAQVVGHELTHSIEDAGAYTDLKSVIFSQIQKQGGDLAKMRQEKAALYEKHGHTLGSEEEIDAEIVAEFVEKNLLTDEASIKAVVTQSPSLGQRILQFINDLLAKIGDRKAQERAFLTKARGYYQTALRETENRPVNVTFKAEAPTQAAPAAKTTQAQTTQTTQEAAQEAATREASQAQEAQAKSSEMTPDEYLESLRDQLARGEISEDEFSDLFDEYYNGGTERQYSFAGQKASTANLEHLKNAQEMETLGADMKSIRKATGWFKGMDGKWRFEIDDSEMTYHRGGDAAFSRDHPDYAEYQKLMRKWMTGEVTAEEETRLRQMDETWGREYGRLSERVDRGNATLEDILDHEALFRAYPQLRRTKVEFADMPKNTMGSYSPSQNLITLSNELRNAPESTLVHEIQHAIQNAEGFTRGSNREYWEEKLTSGDKIQSKGFQDAREKLIKFQLDKANEEALALKDKIEQAGELDDDLTEYDRLWEEAERQGLDGKINEYYDLLNNYYTQMNRPGNSVPSELYYNTAGEIEARDAANRRSMSDWTRKMVPPDYGDENTVFAEDEASGRWYSAEEYDPETASIKEQIAHNKDELNKMSPVAEKTVPKNLLSKTDTYNWAIKELERINYSVYRNGVGEIRISRKDINKGLKYAKTPEERAAIALVPDVLKHGREIGAHENHKGRSKSTITLAAPVVMNGVRGNMAVMVNKNSDSYNAHRIVLPDGRVFKFSDVKKDTTSGLPQGVTQKGSLAKAADAVSDNSIPTNTQSVNKQFSVSERTPEQKKEILAQARRYASGEIGKDEFFRHVDSIDRTRRRAPSRNAYRQPPKNQSYSDEAREIYDRAHSEGVSVDEYLRRNWEEFDIDGRWSDAAQEALRMDGRRYSVEEGSYDINPTKKVGQSVKSDTSLLMTGQPENSDTSSVGDSIRSSSENANKQFSMEAPIEDSNGRRLTNAQREFFKDSKAIDSNGRLLTLYHGTGAKFTVFDKAHIGENFGNRGGDLGFYFSPYIEDAKGYAREAAGYKGKGEVMPVYLNLKNPLIIEDDGWGSAISQADIRHGDLKRWAEEGKHDGIIVKSTDEIDENDMPDAVYIAFSPEQIKNVTNENPTSNPDIRYSVEEETASEEEPKEPRVRDTIPKKAETYLKRAEGALVKDLSDKLNVPKFAQKEYLNEIAQEISEEYLKTGTVSEETKNELFETAWENGRHIDDEFYNTYKDIKDYLKTQSVTLSETDKADITDWNQFKNSAFGSLRIVNKGGLPVDTAYQELQGMAPELFPPDITHPADQIQRMLEVSKSISVSEKSLDDHFGRNAEEYKKWARADFETAITDSLSALRTVKRYVEDGKAPAEKLHTIDEVQNAYKGLKEARKKYEIANAKNLLTDHDKIQVGRLLRGEIELEHLDPKQDNVKGISAVFEAQEEYERIARTIREWNAQRKQELRDEADEYLQTANDWKDKKSGILYARETQERNVLDIVPDEKIAKAINRKYFMPVHQAEAKSTQFKKTMRGRVAALKLSTKETKAMKKAGKVSEAHAVQLIGEARDNAEMASRSRDKTRDGKTEAEWRAIEAELWKNNPDLDKAKIENAIKEFRGIYDELLNMMNDVRIENGYEPVNYRRGYFPHFKKDSADNIIGLFGRALGIKTDVTELPTTINGMTHMFRPGIQWFGNALERTGFETTYDAVEGFDRYIEGVANVIYQTENIQRLRALASQARYRTGPEGLRKQIDAVRADTGKTEAEKTAIIDDLNANGKYELSNWVVNLDEYTNILAGKKSMADRNLEQALGRDMYNVVKAVESRVAANMVAINVGSWLTNFIPITQGYALLGTKDLLTGMKQTLAAMKESDGMVEASAFLTNRIGSDPLVQTWAQKASATLSSPMSWIDNFTAGTLVRGRYNQNIRQGMSEAAAMEDADTFAANVMADRSKGSTPTLFNQANPVTKLFTQFQLEVNNQLSYLFKDIPRETKDKGVKALALALLKFFLGAYLYDEAYEYFIGRRPALDPIGILVDTAQDIANGESAYDVITGTLEDTAEQLPFIGGILGGGRIPISSALPDAGNLLRAATNEDWDSKKRWSTIGKELAKPATYTLLPFGGGQIKKVAQGIDATIRGGSYTYDADGNDILQYPVYNQSFSDSAKSIAESVLFGKTALPTGREWIGSGFKSFGAKETAAYKELTESGTSQKDVYDTLKAIRAEKTNNGKRTAIADSSLTDNEKRILYNHIFGEKQENGTYKSTRTEEIAAFKEAGLDMDDFLKAQNQYTDIGKEYDTTSDKALAFSRWVNQQGWTADQKAAVNDSFKYYSQIPATAANYNSFADAGLSDETAYKLAKAINNLEPQDGADTVSGTQKWRAVVDTVKNTNDQLAALAQVMSESEYRKVSAGRAHGVEPSSYVAFKESLPKFDADGNGTFKQAEIKAAIDAMGEKYGTVLPGGSKLTIAQQAVLWQLANKSWKPKNNPYSVAIGQKVYNELNAK